MICKTGCSGFHYKEWKGKFYPSNLSLSKWFEFYCREFNTVELNVTFYKFPDTVFLRNWNSKSPADFIFSVKAPRLLTHFKQFNDLGSLLGDFYLAAEKGLGTKLGPILFQFPPSFDYSDKRLGLITSQMKNEFSNVVEFRHPSWWNKNVYKILSDHQIIFCGISYPGLPDLTVINNSTFYYRFHGVPKLYYSPYEDFSLRKIAEELNLSTQVSNAFVYFNNTANLAAIQNARLFKRFVEKQ